MVALRCMAEGRDDEWTAICIDLDIAVQGNSFAEVKDSLNQAIDMYLEGVSELPSEERERLLKRRAPWPVRLKYHLLLFLSRFSRRDGGRRRSFTLSAHAPA